MEAVLALLSAFVAYFAIQALQNSTNRVGSQCTEARTVPVFTAVLRCGRYSLQRVQDQQPAPTTKACNGSHCTSAPSHRGTEPTPTAAGVEARVILLFVHGHRGSYAQAQSLAAAAAARNINTHKQKGLSMEVYSLDFVEESSAFHSSLLAEQALAVRDSIAWLLEGEGVDGGELMLLAHSMGGIVVRSALHLWPTLSQHVPLILTTNTPHMHHPFLAETAMASVYNDLRKDLEGELLHNTTIVSIMGGSTDVMVMSYFGALPSSPNLINAISSSLPSVWADQSHDEILNCKPLLDLVRKSVIIASNASVSLAHRRRGVRLLLSSSLPQQLGLISGTVQSLLSNASSSSSSSSSFSGLDLDLDDSRPSLRRRLSSTPLHLRWNSSRPLVLWSSRSCSSLTLSSSSSSSLLVPLPDARCMLVRRAYGAASLSIALRTDSHEGELHAALLPAPIRLAYGASIRVQNRALLRVRLPSVPFAASAWLWRGLYPVPLRLLVVHSVASSPRPGPALLVYSNASLESHYYAGASDTSTIRFHHATHDVPLEAILLFDVASSPSPPSSSSSSSWTISVGVDWLKAFGFLLRFCVSSAAPAALFPLTLLNVRQRGGLALYVGCTALSLLLSLCSPLEEATPGVIAVLATNVVLLALRQLLLSLLGLLMLLCRCRCPNSDGDSGGTNKGGRTPPPLWGAGSGSANAGPVLLLMGVVVFFVSPWASALLLACLATHTRANHALKGTVLGSLPRLYMLASLLKLPLSLAVDDLISADSLMAAPVALHASTLLLQRGPPPHTATLKGRGGGVVDWRVELCVLVSVVVAGSVPCRLYEASAVMALCACALLALQLHEAVEHAQCRAPPHKKRTRSADNETDTNSDDGRDTR